MAVTRGTATSAVITLGWNGSVFESTTAVTVPAGANMLTVVLLGTTTGPSSITYNGVALTSQDAAFTGNTKAARIYDLPNPASGTHNLVLQSGSALGFAMTAIPFSGVDATTPRRGTSTNDAFSGSGSTTTTTVADDAVVAGIITEGAPLTTTAGTELYNGDGPAGGGADYAAVSAFTATGTSSASTWNLTGSTFWAAVAIAYRPGTDAPTQAPITGGAAVLAPMRPLAV